MLLLAVVVSLAAPALASAHAVLLRTLPANGAVLARSPASVRVVFDDTIQIASGNEVVANATRSSVVAGAPITRAATLVIRLRPHLGKGDYSVRWSIVSEDGHHEEGVLAFAIGTTTPPASILTARVPLGTASAIFRGLFFLGLLIAAGSVVFALQMRRLVSRIRQRLAVPLFFALLLAFIGDGWLVGGATDGTRNALVLKVALGVATAGAAAAALAPRVPRLLDVAALCAVALVAAPTLAGHALDRNQPRWLSIPADLAHVGAAAVWLGGLTSLLLLAPSAELDDVTRRAVLARFSRTALLAVAVLALGGILRALTELRAVHQVWDTSYGRALLIKSALFIALVALGAANRAQLTDAFVRVRRIGRVEVLLLVAVVGVVSVLVQLRPGR